MKKHRIVLGMSMCLLGSFSWMNAMESGRSSSAGSGDVPVITTPRLLVRTPAPDFASYVAQVVATGFDLGVSRARCSTKELIGRRKTDRSQETDIRLAITFVRYSRLCKLLDKKSQDALPASDVLAVAKGAGEVLGYWREKHGGSTAKDVQSAQKLFISEFESELAGKTIVE